MIGYLRGQVSHIFGDYCFIEVQGVGYRVFIPNSTTQKLSVGMTANLFTYLNVREDALLLYGFISQEEYDLFLHLISVTGIGPKVGLTILSSVNPDGFRLAVSQKNIGLLTKIPGIGKKTAERLILELKDKLGQLSTSEASDASFAVNQDMSGNDVFSEALEAMAALGYSQAEVMPVLKKFCTQAGTVQEVIKVALRELGRR